MTSNKKLSNWILLAGVAVLGAGAWLTVTANATAKAGTPDTASRVARGKYLVDAIGCADCHTPLVMGPNGPAPDAARQFSGHPQDLKMPPAPDLGNGPWVAAAAGTMTAWAGPWGTSFTANITPDKETGIGAWTEEQFIATIRSQRHLGIGRQLLPPMPAAFYAKLDDEDLRSVFAYLQSIPAVKNRVPEPIPPAGAR
jgi:mono/diheme cytochrome c family protein